MFALTVLVVLCAHAAFAADHVAAAERLLQRLDLKNYDDFASEREKTSTDSTDSSSDANRIARAVEAALEAAELANRPVVDKVAPEFQKLRLRLSTTNAANRCPGFSCADIRRANAVSDIEGAVATVVTTDGTFSATFDATGLAENVNDQFIFRVQYTNGGAGDDSFELSTDLGEFGVNVTSITLSSQDANDAAAGIVYYQVTESSDFDDDTLLTADETLLAALGDSEVGCDIGFNGPNEALLGTSSYSVSVTGDRSFIVADRALQDNAGEPDEINIGQTQTFGGNVFVIENQGRLQQIGVENLPCNSRPRVIYDNIAIVTKIAGTGNTADTLLHPLVYDRLRALAAAPGAPNFDPFLFELRLAAGRTQLRLRDITLDGGVFSDLSHRSKFTPCFRLFPDEDYQVEVFIGMSAGNQVVRGILQDGGAVNLVENGAFTFDDDDQSDTPPLPEGITIPTNEIVFADLVGDQDSLRPFEQVPSDVTIEVESCPEFSYFA